MTIEHFFAALAGAIPTVGAALLALWRVYVKQKADFKSVEEDAAARKEKSDCDHDDIKAALAELTANLTAAQQDAAQARLDAATAIAAREIAEKKLAACEARNAKLQAKLTGADV